MSLVDKTELRKMYPRQCVKCGSMSMCKHRTAAARRLGCHDMAELRRSCVRAWEKTMRGRYVQHKHNADLRGVPFLLTFDQWCSIWNESGKWAQRGNLAGQYCMARNGDVGAYEVGNVRICLVEENHAEWHRVRSAKVERD
jgi:hypothetical protein